MLTSGARYARQPTVTPCARGGIKSGPCYAAILSRLRDARLDGDITTDADENRLLQTLVDEGICNDGTE